MHAGRHYTVREILTWTRRETLVFLALGCVPLLLSAMSLSPPRIPWQPLAVLGTAVAFVTGFKSNAAYGRLWEARKIWGGIVNTSRSFAFLARDFLADREGVGTSARIVHRHLAWLTALRHQLRQERAWESSGLTHNVEYRRSTFSVVEHEISLEQELGSYLDSDDRERVLARKNRALALLDAQSAELARAARRGDLSEYRHVELTRHLSTLVDLQGKCERIKNFPYPRQFATLNLVFIWLFILLIPFGLYAELQRTVTGWAWLTVPFTMVIAWVFHTMDKIGEASENPFEGGANDVPITAMSRGIEIDLRDLLGEADLPPALEPQHNILM